MSTATLDRASLSSARLLGQLHPTPESHCAFQYMTSPLDLLCARDASQRSVSAPAREDHPPVTPTPAHGAENSETVAASPTAAKIQHPSGSIAASALADPVPAASAGHPVDASSAPPASAAGAAPEGSSSAPAAAATVADPVFVPSADTVAYLTTHPQLDYDTQMVRLVTTGAILPDPNHRVAVRQVEPQDMQAVVGIRNSISGTILGSVGGARYTKFRPCQNPLLVESLIQAGFMDRMSTVEATSYNNGGISAILLEAKDPHLCFAIGDHQATVRFQVINGHDGSHSLTVRPMMHLTNTASALGGDIPMFTQAGLLSESRLRHTQQLSATIKELTRVWGGTLNKTADSVKALREFATFQITSVEMKALILASMNQTVDPATPQVVTSSAEKFLRSLDEHVHGRTPETLLELADAVAAHVDNTRPMRQRRDLTPEQSRRQSAVLGQGSRIKEVLIKEAMKMLRKSARGT